HGTERRYVDGVVDVNVERAPFARDTVEETAERREVADIPLHRECAPPESAEAIDDILGIPVASHEVHGDIRAPLPERERDRPPNPARASGDERGFPVERLAHLESS